MDSPRKNEDCFDANLILIKLGWKKNCQFLLTLYKACRISLTHFFRYTLYPLPDNILEHSVDSWHGSNLWNKRVVRPNWQISHYLTLLQTKGFICKDNKSISGSCNQWFLDYGIVERICVEIKDIKLEFSPRILHNK